MKNIRTIHTHRALSPTQISIGSCVINPYRGCTIGCVYCYAKNNKVFRGKANNWGKFLEAKINIPEILESELNSITPPRVLIGSVCEPFVVEEEKFRLTQKILEILNSRRIPYTILTRSLRVKNYLRIITRNRQNKVYFTVNFLNFEAKRKFEPFIDYTLQELKDLFENFRKEELDFRIHISPYIPFIVKPEEVMESFLKYTQDFFVEVYNPLMGSWIKVKNILKQHFPEYANKIICIFENKKDYGEFAENTQEYLKFLERKFGIKLLYFIPEYHSFYHKGIAYENMEKCRRKLEP